LGAGFFASVQSDPGAHPVSSTMGTSLAAHLAPRLKISRAIPLLPFWTFMASSGVNFTFLNFSMEDKSRKYENGRTLSLVGNEAGLIRGGWVRGTQNEGTER